MHDRIYDNICQAIGKTPVVRLNRMPRKGWAEMLVKLESFNPGGSVKDRIGLSMIEAAEREGRLKPGGTIVEPPVGTPESAWRWLPQRRDIRSFSQCRKNIASSG